MTDTGDAARKKSEGAIVRGRATGLRLLASGGLLATTGLLLATCCAVIALPGCSSSDSTSPLGAPSPTSGAARSSSSSHSGLVCPNGEGGSCLGELSAETSYTTQIFSPELTYRVPGRGWSNYEDTPGNFLLVPPGSDLPGVNAGTSDFIGVYTKVAPARITRPNGCVIQPVSGTWSPKKTEAWFRTRPNPTTRRAVPVPIGGLSVVEVDLRTRPGAKLESCTDAGQPVEIAGLFTGLSPSSLDHGVIPGMTMRMILLGADDGVLLIEIDDIDAAPVGLPALTAVANQFRFGDP